MSVAVALLLRRAEDDRCSTYDDDDDDEDGTKATADEMVIADTAERRNRMVAVFLITIAFARLWPYNLMTMMIDAFFLFLFLTSLSSLARS